MQCIYCNKPDEISVSHIIPESLGKGPTLAQEVCKNCNNEINKMFEQKISDDFSAITNFLQLRGKRGKRPSIELEAQFAGQSQRITVRHPKDLEAKTFIFKDVEHNGERKALAIIAKAERIGDIKKEFTKRNPKITWDDMPPDYIEIPL